jgi:hypothetical protein
MHSSTMPVAAGAIKPEPDAAHLTEAPVRGLTSTMLSLAHAAIARLADNNNPTVNSLIRFPPT